MSDASNTYPDKPSPHSHMSVTTSNTPHSTSRYKSTPRGYSRKFRRKYTHNYTIMPKFQPILSHNKPHTTQKISINTAYSF